MKITYCVEFRRKDEHFYTDSFTGFSSKPLAMDFAKNNGFDMHVRVVEQKRKVLKVFPANKPLDPTRDKARVS